MESISPGWRDLSSSTSSTSGSSLSTCSIISIDRNLTDEGTSPSKRVEPSNRLKKPPGSDEEISSSGIFYKMMGEGALTSLGYSRSSPGREGRGPAMFPPHDGTRSS
jgi:hypothetical protein